MRFTPEYSKIKPLFQIWDLYRLGSKSIYDGPQEIEDDIYSHLRDLCKDFSINEHLDNILWYAIDNGNPATEDSVRKAIKAEIKFNEYKTSSHQFTEKYLNKSKKGQVTIITITDNLKNKLQISEPALLDKIYGLLSEEFKLPDTDYLENCQRKGRKKASQWRDDHSLYLFRYLNTYCTTLTDNDRYRFIFSFMKIKGFPFKSLKNDTSKRIADRVGRAIRRVKAIEKSRLIFNFTTT